VKQQVRSKDLHELCRAFTQLVLPASSKTAYKTSTSGTALDFNALPRFIASNFTEKRIWRKKVAVVDSQFRVLLEIRPDKTLKGIDTVLTQLAAMNDFNVYFAESAKVQFLFVSSENFGDKTELVQRQAIRAGVVQVVASLGTDDAGDPKEVAQVQKQMWELASEFHILHSDELSAAEKRELQPINSKTATGFQTIPWDMKGARVYRSQDFSTFIELIGNQKVPGLIDKHGKHLAIMDVLNEIETITPRIPTLYMGGFIRDLIKNKRADDIDFSFATDQEGIKNIARLAEKHGWPYSLGKVKKTPDSRCAELLTHWQELRGGESQVGYYKPLAWLEAVQKLEQELLNKEDGDEDKMDPDRRWAVRASYISFGRPINADGDDLPFAIEGAIPQKGVKGEDGMVELGWAMGDFACNGLNYCSLNKVIIDMSGHGVQDCQGKPPILRIPYGEKQWETWMHLLHHWVNLWRWFKFRARGQTGSSEEAKDKKFVVQQLIQNCKMKSCGRCLSIT
jgi:hypothetical protein